MNAVLYCAPVEAGDYILTALGLPDGTGRVLAHGDGCEGRSVQVEMPVRDYVSAKDLVRRTAEVLESDKESPSGWAEWACTGLLRAARLNGLRVVSIAEYESEVDLWALVQDRSETWLEQRLRAEELVVRLEAAGLQVVRVALDAADYFRWLAREGLKNDSTPRAKFTYLQHTDPDASRHTSPPIRPSTDGDV